MEQVMRIARIFGMLSVSAAVGIAGCVSYTPVSAPTTASKKKVIVFVWDGLRPDSVNATDTPNLAALRDTQGVNFSDNHAVYPTFTMMNASAFATGAYPGTHGFYGNTEYVHGAQGKDSAGKPVDFNQPIFTEDYAILNDLTSYYQGKLYLVGTLFQAAQRAGLTTAAVGKSGAAFIQDYANYAADTQNGNGKGIIFDEKSAFPLSFAKELQAAGYALPKLSTVNYGKQLTLAADNGDPTAPAPVIVTLADKITKDPRSTKGSPYNKANEYMMQVYLDYILPKKNPDLSVVWFRNPDTTEHLYGPGSDAYRDALHSQDKMLGQLLATLKKLHLADSTDVIVVSDHGHSTVAGDPVFFPPRALEGNANGSGVIDSIDRNNGFSVSGDVRTADLLTRAGLTHVYDGSGCLHDPILSGVKANGRQIYPDQVDEDGSICGKPGTIYSTPSYKVPANLPADATIIAANGGSDYVYLTDHDAARLTKIVKILQSRKQYGAIFVASRYGDVPGTMPMTTIKTENGSGHERHPDLMVSFDFDENAFTAINRAVPGTEYESFQNSRGMHGSFSPRDVHNSLFATGPDFHAGYVDHCPSGNVDVAPTVAAILGLTMPEADGRPLLEAFNKSGKTCAVSNITASVVNSSTASGLIVLNPTDVNGTDRDSSRSRYWFALHTKTLQAPDGKTYLYFDQAKAIRQ
jgi:arylsulfatase A-like enzyme